MAEPDGNGISARLWRLPGQLLLSLVNATAILVIVAAIVGSSRLLASTILQRTSRPR